MQLRITKEIEFTRKYWVILLVYVLIILIGFLIAGQICWSFYLIISVVITIFCSLAFWQEYILPELGLTNHISLSKYILLHQLLRSPLVLSVKNGEIEGDFVLLKKKPNIGLINIDQKSAVLIEDLSNKESFLLHGTHVLSKNHKIIGVFYLGISSIQIGPIDKYALEPKIIQESFTEYHSRMNSAEKTKTGLLSGESIYPSFTVFYRLDTCGLYNSDLELFLNLTRLLKGDSSSLKTSHELETYLINKILNNWNIFCKNKKREDILLEFPGKFVPKDLRIEGVISQIFLDQIY